MKEQYEEIKMETIYFEECDIITDSNNEGEIDN